MIAQTNLLEQERTQIVSALINLRKNAKKQVNELSGNLLDDFNMIDLYVKLLYEKPQYAEFSSTAR